MLKIDLQGQKSAKKKIQKKTHTFVEQKENTCFNSRRICGPRQSLKTVLDSWTGLDSLLDKSFCPDFDSLINFLTLQIHIPPFYKMNTGFCLIGLGSATKNISKWEAHAIFHEVRFSRKHNPDKHLPIVPVAPLKPLKKLPSPHLSDLAFG